MPVYPVFNTAIFYVVLQFYDEGSVCFASCKFRVLHAERRNLMRNNYFMFCLADSHGFTDKVYAFFIFLLNSVKVKTSPLYSILLKSDITLSVKYASSKGICPPQCRNDEIYFVQLYNSIIVTMYIWAYLQAVSIF